MAAQKVEHYEIASYGGLVQIAITMGQYEVAEILDKTLMEEEEKKAPVWKVKMPKKMKQDKHHHRRKKATGKKSAKSSGGRKWSAGVTKHSNALDLEKGVFTSGSPEKIASSLERSARQSKRKKGTSYQSAMSMLNFYINRAGKNLSASKKKVLKKAKDKLKEKHENP